MRSLVVTCCLILFLLEIPSLASAQWYADSLTHSPVAVAKWDQKHPQIISDGEGGAIVVWQDLRSSYNWDIYVQRISAQGVRAWGNGGRAICTDNSNQYSPLICSDNAGGAYIVWEDMRNADLDVYAQHINAEGDVSFEANGIPIGKAIREQRNPTLVSNGKGRAIVAWEDLRSTQINIRPDIYLNVLTTSGAIHGEAGTEAAQSQSGQRGPILLADGNGGALLAWQNEYTVPVSVWASLIDSNGVFKWNPGGSMPGLQIFKGLSYANNSSNISLTRDGSKFLMAWQVSNFSENNGEDIYANRVNRDGVVDWQSGLEVTGDWPGDQTHPRIFPDDSGGVLVFFEDYTSDVAPKYYNRDIAAVRFLTDGFVRIPDYDDGFFHIVKQSHAQHNFHLEKDGDRFMFAWDDGRNGGTDTSIYVQSIDRNFNRYFPQYKTNSSWGRVIANRSNSSHKHVAMTKREGGGFILAWADDRNGDQDIYSQILFKDGTLPIELAAFDVRNIGEDVVLDWNTASERDNAGFIVERRNALHGSQFEQIASYETNMALTGGGTTNNKRYYSYTDVPGSGTYEYRLTDVSLDGTRTRQRSRMIQVGEQHHSAIIYPNPVTNGTVVLENASAITKVEIRDMLGKLQITESVEGNRVQVRVHNMSPGVYVITIFGADGVVSTQRLTIIQ